MISYDRIIMKNKTNKGLKKYYTLYKLMPFFASRNWGIHFLNYFNRFYEGKKIKGIYNEERLIPSKNKGPAIRVRIFKPLNYQEKLPLLMYLHGGGYIVGCPEFKPNLAIIKQFIEKRPCVLIAPAYRKALDSPFPAALNDCYDTLLWAKENADELGILDNNFILAGHSAGGGLTAALTLKARDTKDFKLAFQMPIYPMIDDLQNTKSAIKMNNTPAWNSKSNKKGWAAYLAGNEYIPTYATPARNKDYSNFPPTFTFVGDLDPFRDETITYASELEKQNVEVKFKLYEGAFHAFDMIAPDSEIGKKAIKFTYDSYAEFYDKYITNNES